MSKAGSSMTDSELAAFQAGIHHAADLALITAMTIEVRADAHYLRQRAAVEALRALAEALKEQAATRPIESSW